MQIMRPDAVPSIGTSLLAEAAEEGGQSGQHQQQSAHGMDELLPLLLRECLHHCLHYG